jgi:hypothetical protein
MAIHYGSPVLQANENTGKPTYSGTCVSETRRFMLCAAGGQIFLTTAVYTAYDYPYLFPPVSYGSNIVL